MSIPVSNRHVTSPAVAAEAYRFVSREPELIARVVAGDRLAARELYDAHVDRVFRLAFRLTGEGELARELTQETFIRAFAQLERFRGESALSTWLHRVTISVVSNAMRKVKRFRTREADLDEASLMAVETRSADRTCATSCIGRSTNCPRSIERLLSCMMSKGIRTRRSRMSSASRKEPARAGCPWRGPSFARSWRRSQRSGWSDDEPRR